MKVEMELDAKAAQAVLLAIAATESTYNRGWAWWAHDVDVDNTFTHGNMKVTKVQEDLGDSDTAGYRTLETEMIWRFEADDKLGGEDTKFFQLRGEYTSYDGNDWENVVKEVRPTEKVVRVFEFVR